MLTSLSLKETGVGVDTLDEVLSLATELKFLSFSQTVPKPLSLSCKHPLQAPRLQVLQFEISSASTSPRPEVRPKNLEKGCYQYLASSIQAGGLPALSKLYVRDGDFASLLTSDRPPRS